MGVPVIKNSGKADLIAQLNSQQHDPVCVMLLKLLNIEIEELRVQNDTVNFEQLQWNQGKIAAYLQLSDQIRNGLVGR